MYIIEKVFHVCDCLICSQKRVAQKFMLVQVAIKFLSSNLTFMQLGHSSDSKYLKHT